ncbi:MAG: hypothetical protein HY908_34280 [Myxococcales bacterium]|nr:hypothetical protein [Myxococcales bacterium]
MDALATFDRALCSLRLNRPGRAKVAAAILAVGGERALASAAGEPLRAAVVAGLGARALGASRRSMAGLAALCTVGELGLELREARAAFDRGAIDGARYRAETVASVGHALGGLAGAFAGAALGSALWPGVGSVVGGVVGGLVGAAGGVELARAVAARLRALPARGRRPAVAT